MQEVEYKTEVLVCQKENMERDGVSALFAHRKVIRDANVKCCDLTVSLHAEPPRSESSNDDVGVKDYLHEIALKMSSSVRNP